MIQYSDQIQTMINIYFPVLYDRSFADDKEEISSWFRFVDLLCMIHIYEQENPQGQFLTNMGSSEAAKNAIALLAPYQKNRNLYEPRLKEIFDCLIARGQRAADEGRDLFVERLLRLGHLAEAEIAALFIVAASDYDTKYGVVFEALQKKIGKTRPNIGLIVQLCSHFLENTEVVKATLLEESRFFWRLLCEETKDTETGVFAEPRMNRRMLLQLNEKVLKQKPLWNCVKIYDYEKPDSFAHQEEIEKITRLLSGKGDEKLILHLMGAEGIGKKFSVRMAAAQLEKTVICVEVGRFLTLTGYEQKKLLREVAFQCIYEDSVLYLDASKLNLEESTREEKNQFVNAVGFLEDFVDIVVLGSFKSLPQEWTTKGTLYTIEMSAPDSRQQAKFWEAFCEELNVSLEEEIQFDRLVSKYDMTPDKIRRVLQCVCAGEQERTVITKQQLEQQIRNNSGAEFGIYATRINSRYTLEDIGLTPLSSKKFMEACDRVRYRSVVNDDFGFKEKLSYGRGIAVVFYGPPGTGKTMAAQVMANELGLDIYRIDISQITNKYIGETQKNIGKLFEAARNSNAILFFDEADALFVKRTEVSSSNDKHSNSETAFLLQKIEEYSGVSILATNAVNNMDSAFKRRMTYMIEIGQPDEETRLKIWKNIFPKDTPFKEDMKFEVFARVADQLTGSSIKSVAVSAAYYAAAEGRAVTNHDIVTAIDSEYTKLGRLSILSELYTSL